MADLGVRYMEGHGGTGGDGGTTYLQTTQTHLSPAAAVFALSCLELPAWGRVGLVGQETTIGRQRRDWKR